MGKADLVIGGKKKKQKWNLNVKISDEYNFDEIRTFKNGISVSNLANDLGVLLQKRNMIKPFKWKIEFDMNGVTTK